MNVFKKAIVVLLLIFPGTLFADTSWTTGTYSNNQDISKTLLIPDASSIKVKINGKTEKDYDFFIYIMDKQTPL